MSKLQAALLAIGAPCFLSGMARGLLGRNSPIHIRQNRKRALKEVRSGGDQPLAWSKSYVRTSGSVCVCANVAVVLTLVCALRSYCKAGYLLSVSPHRVGHVGYVARNTWYC